MSIRPVVCLFVSAAMLTTALTSTSSAQHWRGDKAPGQRVLRYLGQGFGPGYHWKQPGPNVDYYNPYSAHNSVLISQQYGYQSYQDQNPVSPTGFTSPGVPYSVYAPTGQGGANFSELPGQSINSVFETSNANEKTDSDSGEDNSFQPLPDTKNDQQPEMDDDGDGELNEIFAKD